MGSRMFFLMHQNDVAAPLEIDEESGDVLNIGKERREEQMPLGTGTSKKAFQSWWKRRSVPETRKGLTDALRVLHISTAGSLMVRNLALSLTDTYWIMPADQRISWEQVNLFDNDFDDAIGSFQFSGHAEELSAQTERYFSPGSSLQGELVKKWLVGGDGRRYLIKGNHGRSCQQSLNEVLATEVHRRQGKMPYVSYRLTELDTSEGKTLGCICPAFTGKKVEFIPAIDVNSEGKKPNDVSEFEYFIRQCATFGLREADVRGFLEYQILADFLITNTDRHFHNFGVLRDADSLKFVGVAPIFDSGNAMFWDRPRLEDVDPADIAVSSFRKKESLLLRYVKDRKIFDLSKIPEPEFLEELYRKDETISEKRLAQMIGLYRKKAKMLEEFQR